MESYARRIGTYVQRNWVLALLALMSPAFLVLLLGHCARANALRVELRPTLNIGEAAFELPPITYDYGYLLELNHGIFYLFLAPLIILNAYWFLRSSKEAIAALTETRVLISDGVEPSATQARRSRWLQLAIFLGLLLPIIWFNYYKEAAAYRNARAGTSDNLGYVQAPFLHEWRERFHRRMSTSQHVELVKSVKRTRLWRELREKLPAQIRRYAKTIDGLNDAERDKWLDCLSARPAREYLKSGEFSVNVEKAISSDLVSLRVGVFNSKETLIPREEIESAHLYFLRFAYLMEAVYQACFVWIVIRTLTWLRTVYRWFPRLHDQAKVTPGETTVTVTYGDQPRPRIEPLLADSAHRYGLGELHTPYGHMIAMVFLGAVVFAASILNNYGKGTLSFPSYMSTCLIVLAMAGLMLAGPWFLFGRRLRDIREFAVRELGSLAGKKREDRKPEEAKKLDILQDDVRQQTSWPRKSKRFWAYVVAAFGFMVIPVSLITFGVRSEYVNALDWTYAAAHKIAVWLEYIPR